MYIYGMHNHTRPFTFVRMYVAGLEFHSRRGTAIFLWYGALLFEDNLNLFRNLAKGTTAKAKGTKAIAVGAVG